MSGAVPSRKPYRKAPPQHREARHGLPAPPPQHREAPHGLSAPPPPMQGMDRGQVKAAAPPPVLYKCHWRIPERSRGRRPATAAAGFAARPLRKAAFCADEPAREFFCVAAPTPKSILKKAAVFGKSRLDGCPPAPPLDRRRPPPRRLAISEERAGFSDFLDEMARRVALPVAFVPVSAGKPPSDGHSADRRRRWDARVAELRRSSEVNGGRPLEAALTKWEVNSRVKEDLSDSDRIRLLERQKEDLRRRLSLSARKMEAMEAEFDGSRHYMEAELSRTRDDLDKMRDKFRRLQNSYTASQRANQDLEEKLHALLRTVERDKKTMDREMVELTNKLLEAKNAVDRLEELNERYRLDCNLAVQLLKCNKSHFRNHKFADLPCELQEMLKKQMKSGGLAWPSPAPCGQDPDTLSLTPSDAVPTSVIARVLEKPEPLLLNSARSGSGGRPPGEDVFVHVDMTAGGEDAALPEPARGGEEEDEEEAVAAAAAAVSFDKLDPYPAPPPPNPLCPGRKVIEFSSDDKVKIPKNGPLPNCTYATRQAISLGLRGERAAAKAPPRDTDAPSAQSSPFSSPPQGPSAGASSASSSEDLLANWHRMSADETAAPLSAAAFSDGEEEEGDEGTASSPDGEEDGPAGGLPEVSARLVDFDPAFAAAAALPRPHRSPKRMGVHHLHRQQQ
ncbi:tight junction-associated protein 1 isoform X2 [Stigmatopora nigra]